MLTELDVKRLLGDLKDELIQVIKQEFSEELGKKLEKLENRITAVFKKVDTFTNITNNITVIAENATKIAKFNENQIAEMKDHIDMLSENYEKMEENYNNLSKASEKYLKLEENYNNLSKANDINNVKISILQYRIEDRTNRDL